jgi:hypothetical protein
MQKMRNTVDAKNATYTSSTLAENGRKLEVAWPWVTEPRKDTCQLS